MFLGGLHGSKLSKTTSSRQNHCYLPIHSAPGLFSSFMVFTSKVYHLSFQSETHVGWMKTHGTGQAIRLCPGQVLMHAQPHMGNRWLAVSGSPTLELGAADFTVAAEMEKEWVERMWKCHKNVPNLLKLAFYFIQHLMCYCNPWAAF